MKVQTTRGAQAVLLCHSAGFYDGLADLVAQIAPLITATRARGEALALGLRPSTETALRPMVGSLDDAARLVQPSESDAGSGQTVAARRARQLRELTVGGTRPVTVITEHNSRYDGADGSFWTELDAAMNVALGGLPVTLTCFYPSYPLHVRVVDGARQTHEQLLERGQRRDNPEYLPPAELLAAQPSASPLLLGPPDLRFTFRAWQLHELRAAVHQALLDAGCPPDRAEDVVLAVNEVATNAVEHGGSEAELFLWTGPELTCEVHNPGRLSDPLPGLQPPHPSHPKGRGLWIARQLCDVLHVWADDSGTHVRIQARQ